MSLKNMLPGSVLSQIKEINEKLVKTSTVLSLCVGVQRARRPRASMLPEDGRSQAAPGKKPKLDSRETHVASSRLVVIPPPPVGTLEMSTLSVDGFVLAGPVSMFVLSFVGEEKLEETARKAGLGRVEVDGENPEYVLGRARFMDFPKDIITRISNWIIDRTVGKTHAILRGQRKAGEGFELGRSPSKASSKSNSRVPSRRKPGEEIYETAADCFELLEEKQHHPKVEVTVEDRSTNGTFVNGKRMGKGGKQRLRSGDVIALIFGKEVRLGFRIDFQDN